MLCSIHIFSEVQDGHFVNNDTSACLVQNEALKAFIRILSAFRYPSTPVQLEYPN